MMKNTTALLWIKELLWWLVTALVVVLLLFPAYAVINDRLLINCALLTAVAVTLFRYTVFLNQIPYLKHLYTRVAIIIVVAVCFFQFLRLMQDFLFIKENYTISSFLQDNIIFRTGDNINAVFLYFKQVYLFSNVTVLILSVALILRSIGSLWRLGRHYNFERKEDGPAVQKEQN
jgi:hypothetical protein